MWHDPLTPVEKSEYESDIKTRIIEYYNNKSDYKSDDIKTRIIEYYNNTSDYKSDDSKTRIIQYYNNSGMHQG